MKKLSLFLSILLCVSILMSSAVFAEEETQYVNPFTNEPYETYGNGRIFIYMTHEVSVNWNDFYTAEDFPNLDVEFIVTNIDIIGNYQPAIDDPEARNFLIIVLEDTSDAHMQEALELLYERDDVYTAFPTASFFYSTKDDLSLILKYFGFTPPIDFCGANNIDPDCASFTMYADPDCTVPYFGTEEIDAGSTVYYKLICNDGFFCSRLVFNSGAADSETFVMPEGELDLSASIFRYGDANSDGSITLTDAVFMLKYLSGYRDVINQLRRFECGETLLDFNADGSISLADCTEMLKYIAGWDNAGPVAPEKESGFSVEHPEADAETFEYTLNPYVTDFKVRPTQTLMTKNGSVITDANAFADLLNFALDATDKPVDPDGNEVTVAGLLTEFDEEFFETHDLIPVFALGQKVSVGSVSRDNGNPALELVLGESVPNGLGFTFTAIPKGSPADAILKIGGVTVDQFFGSIPAGN